jgi:hypothetical protein
MRRRKVPKIMTLLETHNLIIAGKTKCFKNNYLLQTLSLYPTTFNDFIPSTFPQINI